MTSRRRTSELSRRGRRGGHWRKDASLFVLFTVACAVLAVVQLAERLWPLAVVGLVAAVVYRARRAAQPSRVIQGRAEPVGMPVSEVGQLRAERDDLRRQVAKLEDDAARHDQLVSDLEDAAGRPIEAVTASYRHVQRQYGPAALGKTGGTR